MAALNSQTITTPTSGGGIIPTAVAVSASDTIANTQVGTTGVILRVINAGASPDVVTITDPNKVGATGSSATNPTVTVANATTKEFFVPAAFIDPTALTITVAHSFITSVTIEVKRI